MSASVTGITGPAIYVGNVFQGAPEYVTTGYTNSGASISTAITSTVGSYVISSVANSSNTATNRAGTGRLNVIKNTETNSHTAETGTKIATTTSTSKTSGRNEIQLQN